MHPSEWQSAQFPADLVPGLHVRKIRCLAERSNKGVFLLEDGDGRRRVFKVYRGQNAASLQAFLERRHTLASAAEGQGLLPLLGHGVDAAGALAWEELAPAEDLTGSRGQASTFESYTPWLAAESLGQQPGDRLGVLLEPAMAILPALQRLHELGLVHGDVKPHNIFRLGGQWVLGDFDSVSPMTETSGVTPSTEGYQPPGGGRGKERDTYAFGKLLYELWTGNNRLEYPSIPRMLLEKPRWGPENELLNRLIASLCAPGSLARVDSLEVARRVLAGIRGGDLSGIRSAERLLRGTPRLRPIGFIAALTAVVLILAAAFYPALSGRWQAAADPSRPGFLSDGLMAFYPFEGDGRDHSGNSEHAAPGGNFEFTPQGLDGSALRVVGDNSLYYSGGGHLVLPTFGLKLDGAFTFSFWVKDDSLGGEPAGHESYLWLSRDGHPHLDVSLNVIVRQIGFYLSPEPGIDPLFEYPVDLRWHSLGWKHLVTAYSPGRFACYINGKQLGETNLSFQLFPVDRAALARHWWASNQASSARMSATFDNLRVYNRELKPDEVTRLYDYERRLEVRTVRPAMAVAIITNGSVAEIRTTHASSGYRKTPTVRLLGGGGQGASASAVINRHGVVVAIRVETPGTGYTNAPTVVID